MYTHGHGRFEERKTTNVCILFFPLQVRELLKKSYWYKSYFDYFEENLIHFAVLIFDRL